MDSRIALVTGGAGFIGSHVVDLLLAKGFKVRVIDNLSGGHEENLVQHRANSNLSCEWLDINSLQPGNSIFKDCNYLFHFAGIGDIVPSVEKPIDYMETNVMGTVKVLECARYYSSLEKFVYAASSSCYGLAATPTQESCPIAPQYPYALSKYQGECAVHHWHHVYGLPVNVLRIFNAYGTRVRTTGAYGAVFGVFFKQKLENKPYTIVGDGNQRRDFLYVTDVARAFLAAAETNKVDEIWNLGAGNPQTINYLVQLLGAENGVVHIPRRPGEPLCTWADISKIKKDLGWAPTVSFEQGVRNMLGEIERWRNAPLWDAQSIAEATKSWFECLAEEEQLN